MEKLKLKVAVVDSLAEAEIAFKVYGGDVAILRLSCDLHGCCEFAYCKLCFKDQTVEVAVFETVLLRPDSPVWILHKSADQIIHDLEKFFEVERVDAPRELYKSR